MEANKEAILKSRRAGPGWFRPGWGLRFALGSVAVVFLVVFIVVPAVNVFAQAFRMGMGAYTAVFFPPELDQKELAEVRGKIEAFDAELAKLPTVQRLKAQRARSGERSALSDRIRELEGPGERAKKNWSAVRMTVGIALIVVPMNVIFGIAAAWAVTKFHFKGKTLLVSVIDLPFSVSPVVAGMIFVLLFGGQGFLAVWAKSDQAKWLVPVVKGLPVALCAILAARVVWWMVMRVAEEIAGGGVAASARTGLEVGAEARRHEGTGARREEEKSKAGRILARWGGWIFAGVVIIGALTWAYVMEKGWSWEFLDPTDWGWWCPYWRGFGNGHWWPIGLEKQFGVIFTPAAIALASIFVTFPFVARSLIPLMESQGQEAEQAAITLGASGWYTFRKVTLPNIKWGLLYGSILCTARALGEFGAVSVVTANQDSLNTMPLRVEQLWQGGGKGLGTSTQAAFTVASMLACLAIVTLVLKTVIEWKTGRSKDEG